MDKKYTMPGDEISLFIGLKEKNMKTALSYRPSVKLITKRLIDAGIIGFNIERIKGSWNASEEDALKVSFINTFNVSNSSIKAAVMDIKCDLNQESILMQTRPVSYAFL
jgi:hypothetical protein